MDSKTYEDRRGMKIIFLNPPIKLGKTFAHYPLFSNLGMLQNAAILEEGGFSVNVIDAFYLSPEINYRPIEEDLYHLGVELHVLESIVKKTHSDIYIIPITMFSDVEKLDETYIREISYIIKKYHKSSILIAADCYICGMNYFAYDSIKFLTKVKEIDINLKGETDITLLETVNYLNKNKFSSLPYGYFRKDGRIIQADTNKHYITNLNTLPYPAFHLLNMTNYFNVLMQASQLDLIHEYHRPERFLPLMTSRGCLFSCNFCTQQVLGMPYRYYSIEYLKREIQYFKKKYRIDRFLFLDNNINADIERFDHLITFLSENKISWDAVNGFRADRLKKEHIKKIKDAGNTKITISAESGDPEVLREVVNKRLNLKAVIDVVKWAYEVKLQSQVHYIIGMPGETIEKMNRTLEFAEMLYEMYNAWPLLQHAIPFRNTHLYRVCEKNGYFTIPPDKTPTHYLEKYPVIKTENFTSEDTLTIKNHFMQKFKFYETTSFVKINNSCNNNCVHCEVSDRLNKKPISKKEIAAQFEEIKKSGKKNIIITGGEPTINTENLFYALKKAQEFKIQNISLSTNGRMFAYKDFVKDVINSNVNQVSVSINGPTPDIHDSITGIKGSFLQSYKGIQNLLSLGFHNINISIRVTSKNQSFIKGIIDLFYKMDIKNFYIRVAVPSGRVLNNLDILPDLSKLSIFLNNILSKYKDTNIKIIGLPFCMLDKKFIESLTYYPPLYNYYYRHNKVKTKECLGCIHYTSCLGFYRPEFNTYYNQT
jgi:MoaA/NifB/PqqE/SkfB family radical SAM enzyme